MRDNRNKQTFTLLAALIAALALMASASAHAAPAARVTCPPQLRSFVHTLAEIRGRLKVGISYAKYKALVTHAEIQRSELPTLGESAPCQVIVNAADRGLDAYNRAYQSWRQCVTHPLPAPPCNQAGTTGDQFRQRYWEKADAEVYAAVQLVGISSF